MIRVAMHAFAILAICLLLPVGVFLHELGHAIPPVVAGGRAHVVVGSEEGRTLDVGPIRVTVGANGIWSPLYYGYCDWETDRSRTVHAIALLCGPATTILVIAAVIGTLSTVRNEFVEFALVGFCYSQVSVAIFTLVPVRYPSWWGQYAGDTSDGYKVLELVGDSLARD